MGMRFTAIARHTIAAKQRLKAYAGLNGRFFMVSLKQPVKGHRGRKSFPARFHGQRNVPERIVGAARESVEEALLTEFTRGARRRRRTWDSYEIPR
jgi:hypothetical protein